MSKFRSKAPLAVTCAVSPSHHRWTWTAWLGGIGICLLFVALRWNNYDAPLIRDEGEYTYAASLFKAGIPPYANSFLQKPPMVVYTYALAATLMPGKFWSARILAYGFVAASTLLLGWIARQEFGPGVALTAMWLFTPMVLLPQVDQFTANTEMFLILPLLATTALFVLARSKKNTTALWFWAGFFGAITFWYKYTAIPVLLAIFIAWSVREWLASAKTKLPWRGWILAGTGAILATAGVMSFFLNRGGLRALWQCTISFNRYYAGGAGNFGWSELFETVFHFFSNWWILFVLTFALIACRDRRVWIWSGLFLSAWIATARSYYPQYYIIIMPFWALLCAVGINHLAVRLGKKFSLPLPLTKPVLLVIVMALICMPDYDWMTDSKWEFCNGKLNTTNPFRESELMAEKVTAITATNEPIYVAGSEPQIYCYAHRRSVTRFIIAYPFILPTPLAESLQQEAIADLEKNPPNVMVFARAEESWLLQKGTPPFFFNFFQKFMAENYKIVGATFQVGNRIEWKEPVSLPETQNASLVLLRHK